MNMTGNETFVSSTSALLLFSFTVSSFMRFGGYETLEEKNLHLARLQQN
jgi:hypothetical protein